MADTNKSKGNFFFGFFLTLLAWLLSSALIVGIRFKLKPNFTLNDLGGIVLLWDIVVPLFIWIPLALVAGNMAKDKGKKSVRNFIIASFFITTLIYGGCAGMLISP